VSEDGELVEAPSTKLAREVLGLGLEAPVHAWREMAPPEAGEIRGENLPVREPRRFEGLAEAARVGAEAMEEKKGRRRHARFR
jgi:hypothetical protein